MYITLTHADKGTPIVVCVEQISSIKARHWQSFRPPSGSIVTMINGETLEVSEEPNAIRRTMLGPVPGH